MRQKLNHGYLLRRTILIFSKLLLQTEQVVETIDTNSQVCSEKETLSIRLHRFDDSESSIFEQKVNREEVERKHEFKVTVSINK